MCASLKAFLIAVLAIGLVLKSHHIVAVKVEMAVEAFLIILGEASRANPSYSSIAKFDFLAIILFVKLGASGASDIVGGNTNITHQILIA